MATSKTRDKVEGKLDKAKGRAKDALGAATGNDAKRAEGIGDKIKGTAKNKKGHLKDLA